MSYQVLIERRAQKEISRLPTALVFRVSEAIDCLSDEPRPPGCKKLTGSRNEWRIRVVHRELRQRFRNLIEP